jgi:hypothetical protein
MLITPFIAKTVRTLERKKAKIESELGIVNDVLAALNHQAISTKHRNSRGIRKALRAKAK